MLLSLIAWTPKPEPLLPKTPVPDPPVALFNSVTADFCRRANARTYDSGSPTHSSAYNPYSTTVVLAKNASNAAVGSALPEDSKVLTGTKDSDAGHIGDSIADWTTLTIYSAKRTLNVYSISRIRAFSTGRKRGSFKSCPREGARACCQ